MVTVRDIKDLIKKFALPDDAEIVVWFDKSISEDIGYVSSAYTSGESQDNEIVGTPALHINVSI